MTDPIEDAARRIRELERSCWRRGLNMAHPVVAEELREILREVRRQALEEACAAMCEWCEAGDELFRDPSPEWDWYHVDEDSDEAFDCDAGRIRALMDPSPAQSSSGPAIVDPGANAEATEPSSKP